MPLYDYRCTACEREVEVMHGIHEGGPQSCPDCGGVMRKALSTPAIHFKGSGWAKKDAASSAKKAKGPTSSDSKPADTSSDASSSDAGVTTESKADSGPATPSTTASSAGSSTD